MKFYKYVAYVYLIFGLFFIYDGIDKLSEKNEKGWFSLVIAVAAIAMFFFRQWYARKIEERNKKP